MGSSAEKKTGCLAVLSGPSGVGKSTIIARLLENPLFSLSTSATTRAPRDGEVDVREYHFLSVEAFRSRIDEGAFLEWAQVHGSVYYGTLRSEVMHLQEEGHIVLLDIDVQGFRNLTNDVPLVSVFIAPPDIETLTARLEGRGTESAESLQARISSVEAELQQKDAYDHVVINRDLEVAVNTVQNLLLNHSKSEQ